MKPSRRLLFVAAPLLVAGGAAFFVSGSAKERQKPDDPRTSAPLVVVVEAKAIGAVDRGLTGSVSARVQSNLGFRVAGKIVERLVDAGERVRVGQPLMRIDVADLRLALAAKKNAASAARAVAVQARADEKRYATLEKQGWATHQRYEQAKAAMDGAEAQLAAAEADANVAENEAGYSTLNADADGTVVETLGEPGQVVSAGQIVARLAHAGQREAIVALPETLKPAIGSQAQASVYGLGQRRWPARLRQLSDSADLQTRTYEARYVLDGEAAAAPLGATVTIWVADPRAPAAVEAPIGAIFDDGRKTGVWIVDRAASTVSFKPVTILRLAGETAIISGVHAGEPVVALGAHLLHEGAAIRSLVAKGA
ncbi:efflux transporter periplasmic adaptor subunit [Rhodoblastus sphagnicola]|uniref:Efflux transporter periplasmic adaptor subunit n=1 Tax=Rhodoblastus sphagnicola TaxID=333368 RepID=A0A2S6N0Q5_9HYPH|nr:efflux RND transporter periplasmic adaptor subunit [Rhodoblastus sphagnicola]MBB4200468.1 RND family efflux transporter MFP subunit [Rhodoblastus sphagnicola]PPQ28179.1 efflux transporter periplasmic adaptor subunit [Rhodoblastus sphagnicola]